MARKLPWSTGPEPPTKRQRTIETSIKASPPPKITQIKNEPTTPARGCFNTANPFRRRYGSRSPSTSPPPAPPSVEPMIKGYDADDAWMMVEDEFQSLAQSFTRHLHHAEYKRLQQKAKQAPKMPLPEPLSPMSKKTRDKLQRDSLSKQQQEALDRIISVKAMTGLEPEEEKVDDPWRGTHLAGLMGASSQERRSLKGLERMPSSTKAAQGFECQKAPTDVEEVADFADKGSLSGESILGRKDVSRTKTRVGTEAGRDRREMSPKSDRRRSKDTNSSSFNAERSPTRASSVESPQKTIETGIVKRRPYGKPARAQDTNTNPTSMLSKRKEVKEESKKDRLGEVPIFLF